MIGAALAKSGIAAEPLTEIPVLCQELARGAGAVILTEESLNPAALGLLSLALQQQEPWSDIPVIILTGDGERDAERTWVTLRALEPMANVSLLERPLRSITLVSAVQVALRSRQRQYEVRSMNAELERRVAERTAELQRLIHEAEGFSYTISHDLRAPLRSIVSTSKILLEDFGPQLPQAAKEELNRQSRAASNLAQLIDDLLRLSRLAREEMHPVDFDLSHVANDVVGQLFLEFPESPCTFEVQGGMTAHGDPTLVRFVLLNLLQNACKFSPKGGRIVVGQCEDGSFYVRDQGIGFDPQYAHKMYLPFERLVNSSEFPGTGIGLANVKRIIERHNGSVWATSEGVGKGATFYFTLL